MAHLCSHATIGGGGAQRSEPGRGKGVEPGPFVHWETAVAPEGRAAARDSELGERAGAQAHAVRGLEIRAGFAAAQAGRPRVGGEIADSLGHGALIRLNVGNSSTARETPRAIRCETPG